MMFKRIISILLLTVMIISLSNIADAFGNRESSEREETDFRGARFYAIVVNCEEWISLRYAPSDESPRLIEIPLGTVVAVYDGPTWGINGFFPVEYAGMKGYCLKTYLEYHSGGGVAK